MELNSLFSRAVATALVPAVVVGLAAPAVAASNTLTITTLDRAGKKVAVTTTVVNLATNSSRSVKSNKATKLPKGTYAVLASISTGSVTTLGARTVKVSGASKTTVDARKGKKVRLGLSPAPTGDAVSAQITAQICTRSDSASYEVEASAWGSGSLHVIPNSSKKLAFAAMGQWSDGSGLTDSYAVMHTSIGVPSGVSRTFKRSSLATVNVAGRQGPSATVDGSHLAVQPTGRVCGDHMYAGLFGADRPYRTKVHLSPGKWDIRASSYAAAKDGSTVVVGGYMVPRTVVAGKSYTLNFFRSAWGPSTRLPMVLNGRISYSLNDMFADPGFPRDSVEGGDKATATLTFGGKTVKTKKDKGWEPYFTTLEYKVKKAGWYKLTNNASRYYPEITFPAGMLSPKTSVTYRFRAKPNTSVTAPVYAITMLPTGLSLYNRAKPGSTTNVQLKLSRSKFSPDAKLGTNPKVKTVTAKASYDGGKTWRSVKVKKISGKWTAQVGNPQSGAVSLRARVTDATGGYTDVTIIRAYAIG
ncbi:hypothetical protein SAMN05443287_11727 [Micromonospora phaseoli]|uniref:Uncharacterized protein n=1 Tax=Micromonospora phaseoli TaxID=1144548 RepID=A0A1H7DT91_9ACTN|nr:hypothetical protein [Micromonospora phaseoli]PZV99178.1 hypothetical protein CLV64_104415 [Micromonospora phaseoli]GIJ80026.1 hypothetical protein Xph01_44580 [Micromonospora phaseoli]SEK04748.1 hypothetical protein SAMN05443287_11727 [Micromonospora phaseoli]